MMILSRKTPGGYFYPPILFLLCLLPAGLLACHRGHSPTPETPATKEAQPPVRVEVTQAFFVAENLHVTVQVFARTEVDPKQLLVRLLGLKQGEIIQKVAERAAEVAGDDKLEEGESILFRLKIPAEELTEYQVQVAWGQESLEQDSSPKIPAKKTKPRIPSVLDIVGSELEEQETNCEQPPCDKRYAIRAEVANLGTQPVGNIRLAVGIYFAPAGQVPTQKAHGEPLADGEELLNLGELRLLAGERKKIKIEVDRTVPNVPGGNFLPYARVIDFQIEAQ